MRAEFGQATTTDGRGHDRGLELLENQSPAITGTRCARTGMTKSARGTSYRCVKSGSSLLWRRTPVVTTTTTTTTTLPTPVDEVALKIHDVLTAAKSRDVKSTIRVDYLSEEPVNALEDSAKVGVDRALTLFAQLGFAVPNDVIVLFAKTEAGVKSILIGQGCDSWALRSPSVTFLGSTGGALNGKCSANRVAVIASPVSGWGNPSGIEFQHTLPHELFHQWQMNSTRLCGQFACNSGDFPRWLFEGTAQLMTRLAYASWNQSKTHQQWHDYWYDNDRKRDREMCVGVPIEEMVTPYTPWPGPGWCAYSKGQLAIELLVANYGGMDVLRKLHTERSTSGLGDFPAFFRRITGVELAQFYSEVNSYFVKRGWN